MNLTPRLRSARRAAFTLVELLVSVSLTAVLMWGILQLYTQATRFSATMFSEAELVSGARAVLDRMCHELTSAATLDVGYMKITNDNTTKLDTLQFVAPVGPNGELAHVRYRVDTDGMLYRDVVVPNSDGDPPLTSVPADGVYASGTAINSPLGVKLDRIDIRYISYTSTTGSVTDGFAEWDDPATEHLPRAILVELHLANNQGTVSMIISSGAYLGGSGI